MRNSLEKYFECKVKYVKMQEDGKEKKVSEQYVVSALRRLLKKKKHSQPHMSLTG